MSLFGMAILAETTNISSWGFRNRSIGRQPRKHALLLIKWEHRKGKNAHEMIWYEIFMNILFFKNCCTRKTTHIRTEVTKLLVNAKIIKIVLGYIIWFEIPQHCISRFIFSETQPLIPSQASWPKQSDFPPNRWFPNKKNNVFHGGIWYQNGFCVSESSSKWFFLSIEGFCIKDAPDLSSQCARSVLCIATYFVAARRQACKCFVSGHHNHSHIVWCGSCERRSHRPTHIQRTCLHWSVHGSHGLASHRGTPWYEWCPGHRPPPTSCR